MKSIRIIVLLSVIAFLPSSSFSFQGTGQGAGCGQDCASCHSLTKEEAGKLLKIEATNVSQALVKGLWEVEGNQNGKKVKVYLDYGKKYAVLINAFIPIEQIGKQPALRKIDLSQIPLSDALVMGNPLAKKRVIVFTDPDCPYCKKLHAEIKDIIKKNKDIAFYIKLFPLVKLHPEAYEKSRAILCKNSLKLLDDAVEGKGLPKADCDSKTVDENIKLAEKLGIGGTPTMILPDGRVIPGYVDGPTLLKLMETPQ